MEGQPLIVLVSSDMAGKPVNVGLARTFKPNTELKVFTLTNDVVIDYASSMAEKVFKDLGRKVKELVAEFKKSVFYLMCSGAVINACVVAFVLRDLLDPGQIRLLVWERNRKRYEVFDMYGETVLDENVRAQTDEAEEEGGEESWR